MLGIGIVVIITGLMVLFGKRIMLRIQDPRLFYLFVRRYGRMDRKCFPVPDSIVFIGGSVVKYWKSMETDLTPLNVLNRGMAGAKMGDIAYWVNELVLQYKPAAVVVYAGSNDLQGTRPKTPGQVLNGFETFVSAVHAVDLETPVYYISITPSPGKTRWKNWPVVRETNESIREYCSSKSNLHYLDTTEAFMGLDGKPNPDYFIEDGIHFNEKGYAIWTSKLKSALAVFLPGDMYGPERKPDLSPVTAR